MQGAEISGVVKVDSKLTKRPLVSAVYDLRGMAAPQTGKAPHDQQGVGRVAVWLEGSGLPGTPVTAKMDQRGRRFDPDMLIVPVGSRVTFPNLDPIFHNIFSLSKTQPFDLGFYAEGKIRDVQFTRTGIVQIYCHVHPEMYAVVVVTPNAWFARPDRDGMFGWKNVPPGKYRVGIWQRSAGLIHRAVTLHDGEDAHLTLSLPDETSE
jgi:plastocyanin